jgi:hypothetical protein
MRTGRLQIVMRAWSKNQPDPRPTKADTLLGRHERMVES